jgi:hypothetical protein
MMHPVSPFDFFLHNRGLFQVPATASRDFAFSWAGVICKLALISVLILPQEKNARSTTQF